MKMNRRLAKIEKTVNLFDDIRHIIGRFYDELSEQEKVVYCHYVTGLYDIAGIEEVELSINGNLHFRCERKSKDTGEKALKELVKEIEKSILE